MASYEESRTFAVGPERVRAAVEQAAAGLGWTVQGTGDGALTVKEKFSLMSFSWPATLTVDVKGAGATTEVSVKASNFGFGPIQVRAMKVRVEKLLSALDVAAAGAG